ncbi:hypothetical protein JAAARDRAFT_124777 [Jaapia argillacea MUCL 33604]|uniref:Protein kinase domain-containing protein n=1 Tax=Jaapia argillacea MUCL 33604 TaxID=933084 RepID=A0A067Q4H3_9AGAM|nr:hypothetical protein JAAARDRAFT_124777 [Jaapia argillacea MUCL 33604]
MAHRRPTSSVSSTSTTAQSRYKLRHSPTSRKRSYTRPKPVVVNSHASSASSDSLPETPRAVLVPLHPNLRRLPSRLHLAEKAVMRDASDTIQAQVGSKRKRVVSGNENVTGGGRPNRRVKRLRSASRRAETSEDEATSGMDIDTHERWPVHSESEDEEDVGSSDDHLINTASARELQRLRKDELIRLYIAAGLTDDADSLTKLEIVEAIISARDDVADLPPSSPPGRNDGNSSEYSSDDGNIAGGEETDIAGRYGPRANGLRRRVTVHELGQNIAKPVKGRSLSLGQLDIPSTKKAKYGNIMKSPSDVNGARRKPSNRSSPTTSSVNSLPSPPATRLRNRRLPTEESILATPTSKNGKGKAKAKQVEFCDQVEVNGIVHFEDDSDLTDLTELEELAPPVTPSPRRLRSKDKPVLQGTKSRPGSSDGASIPATKERRVMSTKKGKGRAVEPDPEEEVEEDEVDELVSSKSPTPAPQSPPRRTPVRRRLRPRKVQTHTPPGDSSDDGEEGDDEEEADEVEETIDGAEEDDVEETVVVEPRKLRNGKIVGDGEVEIAEEDIEDSDGQDEDEDEDDEQGDSEEDEQEEQAIDEDEDAEMHDGELDAEGETEESEESDEAMEDDVDLTAVTVKALVRLRRDDLIRMCETRDIEPVGTKPQLADALLQWRDRQTEVSSPSSTGTVRPPSTARPRANGRQKKSRSYSKSPPVLFRGDRVHVEQPQTPPCSGNARKEAEPELELDLESLGLEDREIPPEKLTKLEKIGSGGFKDVFIGRFVKRKVAIAEFRGQLSSMDIKELKLLGDFDHPNIVRFLGVSIPENTRETPVMIVSELCSNGDLFDYVRNVQPPTLYKVLCMMLDIAHGLEYLHMRKPSVIHRDCKSSNILITSKGVAKITDFGLAKVKQSTRSMVRSLVGTVNWQAPELWHAHPKYNHKVDVFSCAMVFWEMLQWHLPNKKFPWEGMNEHAIYETVGAKRQRPSVSGLRRQWCPEIVDLIERMWLHEPQDRPTMSQVVEELEHLVSLYR